MRISICICYILLLVGPILGIDWLTAQNCFMSQLLSTYRRYASAHRAAMHQLPLTSLCDLRCQADTLAGQDVSDSVRDGVAGLFKNCLDSDGKTTVRVNTTTTPYYHLLILLSSSAAITRRKLPVRDHGHDPRSSSPTSGCFNCFCPRLGADERRVQAVRVHVHKQDGHPNRSADRGSQSKRIHKAGQGDAGECQQSGHPPGVVSLQCSDRRRRCFWSTTGELSVNYVWMRTGLKPDD